MEDNLRAGLTVRLTLDLQITVSTRRGEIKVEGYTTPPFQRIEKAALEQCKPEILKALATAAREPSTDG